MPLASSLPLMKRILVLLAKIKSNYASPNPWDLPRENEPCGSPESRPFVHRINGGWGDVLSTSKARQLNSYRNLMALHTSEKHSLLGPQFHHLGSEHLCSGPLLK